MIKSTDVVTLAGRRGKGKTTLTKYLAANAINSGLLIYDVLHQYSTFPDAVRWLPKSDNILEFEAACKVLMQRAREGKSTFFVIEEAEKYLKQGRTLPPTAFEVIHRGRNWGIGLLAVTRRIQSLSKEFFDLSDHVILFNCGLRAKSYLEDMIGKTESLRVARLDNFCFLHYDLDVFDEDDAKTYPTPQTVPACYAK